MPLRNDQVLMGAEGGWIDRIDFLKSWMWQPQKGCGEYRRLKWLPNFCWWQISLISMFVSERGAYSGRLYKPSTKLGEQAMGKSSSASSSSSKSAIDKVSRYLLCGFSRGFLVLMAEFIFRLSLRKVVKKRRATWNYSKRNFSGKFKFIYTNHAL